MRLMFIFGGLATFGLMILASMLPVLRNADSLMPDHDQLPAAAPAPPGAQDDRLERLQELLEARQRLLSAPNSAENQLALRSISAQLRQLGKPNS